MYIKIHCHFYVNCKYLADLTTNGNSMVNNYSNDETVNIKNRYDV